LLKSVKLSSKKAVKYFRKETGKMSNLSKRVEKAKKLNYNHNRYTPNLWSTWGSKSADYGEKYYQVTLSHTQEIINTPDSQKRISVFLVNCQKDTGSGHTCNCPGNERHTVCYHGLGAIYRSFESAKKLISFFETYESAKCMSFGGKVAKVKSANGRGFVWCVIKDWPMTKVEILPAQENVNLMRGSENDEGID
jgi:hypothetical protein